jgi:hypothetical protein
MDGCLPTAGLAREVRFIAIRHGKSKNAKRNLSLTAPVAEMLARTAAAKSPWVFPGDAPGTPILGTSLGHLHDTVRADSKLLQDFVIYSLGH